MTWRHLCRGLPVKRIKHWCQLSQNSIREQWYTRYTELKDPEHSSALAKRSMPAGNGSCKTLASDKRSSAHRLSNWTATSCQVYLLSSSSTIHIAQRMLTWTPNNFYHATKRPMVIETRQAKKPYSWRSSLFTAVQLPCNHVRPVCVRSKDWKTQQPQKPSPVITLKTMAFSVQHIKLNYYAASTSNVIYQEAAALS